MTAAPLDNPGAAIAAIDALAADHLAALPAPSQAVLQASYTSPVMRIRDCAEALYAAATSLPAGDAKTAAASCCAQLADLSVASQWSTLGQSDRGPKMSGACSRILGLGSQATADDPAVLAAFA